MILSKTEFVIYETISASFLIYIANEKRMSTIEQDSITLQSNVNDVVMNVIIHEVLHVSKLVIELFSVIVLSIARVESSENYERNTVSSRENHRVTTEKTSS